MTIKKTFIACPFCHKTAKPFGDYSVTPGDGYNMPLTEKTAYYCEHCNRYMSEEEIELEITKCPICGSHRRIMEEGETGDSGTVYFYKSYFCDECKK